MDHVSTHLFPTIAALALVTAWYFLWGHKKIFTRQRVANRHFKAASGATSPTIVIEAGEQSERTSTVAQVHEEVQADEDALLLQQYNWSGYTKVPTPVAAFFEATLLGHILSNLGVTLNQEGASNLLSANAGLRSTLLECWKTGCFDPLRRHATIVALLKNSPYCQTEGAADATPRFDAGLEMTQPNPVSVTAIKNGPDAALTARDDSPDWSGDVLESRKLIEGEREEHAKVIRNMGSIQLDKPENNTTTTENSTRVDIPPLPINVEVPTRRVHADTERTDGTPEAVFDLPKTRDTIEIYGGNFKNIAGDNWEIIYASDHHRKVAKWYSSTDYRMTHYDISKKRADNTGVWLLESELFRKWQTDPNCRILWCPGIPGVGKTTIASLVIDHLRQFRSETVAVGFAYFNYKLQDQQSTTTVLECLCRQLYEVYQGEGASSSLEAFYETNQKDHPHPPAAELHPTLSSACRRFQQYYIVLDALDEYLEICNIVTLRELLGALASLGSIVKLLVTSRILSGMEELFREFGAIREDITARDKDMSIYIRNRISTTGFCSGISDELSREIVEKVKEAAGGRFLMAELHMNTLAGQLNPGFLKRALANLPHDIDVTYERVLQRFKTYPDLHRELVKMTLAWVTRAKRQLSVRELQHALATEPGLKNIEDYVTPISTITSLCAGLVIVRDGSVILVHFTAQDFFDNCHIQSKYFPSAEGSVFKACLAYLSLPLSIATLPDASSEARTRIIPFYDYAADNLGLHGQDEIASKDVDAFITSSDMAPHLCCIYLLASFTIYYHVSDSTPTTTVSHIFLAIYYNRITLLPDLLDLLKEVPLTAKGRTPLMYAAHLGRTACLEAMLGWFNARPNVMISGPPSDKQDVWEVLLTGDINERDVAGETALAHACRRGHKEAVALLLNHESIDINLADNNGRTPLSHAAGEGREGVVGLLLNHKGIDVDSSDTDGRTPLSHAAGEGHTGVVELLLNHEGIDVNLAESDGWTPLTWAAYKGHVGVVGLLLNHESIDVTSADDDGRTPLSYTAEEGHEGVVGLLLNHEGIDVNVVDKDGWTPLICAADSHREAVTKLLLGHPKIQLNRQDTKGTTALTRTIIDWYGSLNNDVDAAKPVIQLLLSRDDLDINLPDNKGHTPLFYAQRAAEEKNQQWEEVCVLLRARGAVEPPDWSDFIHDSLFPHLFISSAFPFDW